MGEFLTWWLIGWAIMSIAIFVYNVFIYKYNIKSKKLIMYESIKYGIFSWMAIILFGSFLLTYVIVIIDEYLTKKLS